MRETVQLSGENDGDSVDEAAIQVAFDVGKPEEAAQRRYEMLAGSAREGLTDFDYVVMHDARSEAAKIRKGALLFERLQKRPDMQTSQDYSRIGEPLRRFEKVQVAIQEIGRC